jgi:hypothetical protein
MPQQQQQLDGIHYATVAAAHLYQEAQGHLDYATPLLVLLLLVLLLLLLQAKDGVCDDGRFVANMTRGLSSRVLCDLGTDCR